MIPENINFGKSGIQRLMTISCRTGMYQQGAVGYNGVHGRDNGGW